MIWPMRKFLLLVFLLGFSFFGSYTSVRALECDDKQGQEKVTCLEKVTQELDSQEKTLSSQIAVMDSQIRLTEARIFATKQEITELALDIDTANKKISNLENALDDLIKILLNRIVTTYEIGRIQPFEILLSSANVTNFFSRLNYLKVVQVHDKQLIYLTQQAKSDYANQKDIFEAKKKRAEILKASLDRYTAQLAQEKASKQALLTETKGENAVYQSLLTEARKQLRRLASFADSFGASLLSNQTSCNEWGCYYNQRDSQWGNILINGSNDCNGPCSNARVGCLVTSVSMVVSYLGNRNILPSDIAVSDPSNFSVGTALLRKGTISVKGVNINRVTISGSLSPDLVQNGPVIVGIYHGVFGTHFVVVKSYTDGKYIMNDPFTEGGKDKVFTDYYSLGNVFSVDRVSM